jgi:hypothetical protein
MEKITTVGIDLAKSVFSLHGVDGAGRVVLRRTLRRQAAQAAEGLPELARRAIGDRRIQRRASARLLQY